MLLRSNTAQMKEDGRCCGRPHNMLLLELPLVHILTRDQVLLGLFIELHSRL